MARVEPPHDRMMAYLDGELPANERKAFERLLDEHPDWREEMAEMAEVVGATRQLRLRPPDAEVWDNYWEEIDSRLHRSVGWTAALAGSMLLILWGFVKVLAYAENDFVRGGILLVGAGIVILFFTVLRGRMVEAPRDRYRRIRK